MERDPFKKDKLEEACVHKSTWVLQIMVVMSQFYICIVREFIN